MKIPSKKKLSKLYFDSKKSTWEIAKEFGVSQMQVCRWFKRLNIQTRSYSEASKITLNGFKGAEEHHNWKGDSVGYNALHVWVRNHKPKSDTCEDCGKKKRLDLSNKGIYDRNFENWEWLCRKCHMKKDGRTKTCN